MKRVRILMSKSASPKYDSAARVSTDKVEALKRQIAARRNESIKVGRELNKALRSTERRLEYVGAGEGQ